MRRLAKTLLLGASAAIATLAATGAQATINITSYAEDMGSVGGTIHWTNPNPRGGNVSVNTGIGRFTIAGTDTSTGSAVSYQSYCVDIFQYISNNMSMTVTPLSDYLSVYGSAAATKVSQLNALIANGNGGVTDATTSAAMQMAVWEIVYDYTSSSAYSLESGAFTVTGSGADFTTARNLADTYVGNVTSNLWRADPNYTLSVLRSDSYQDQLVFTRAQSAVPEPATWGLMLVGFGGIGAALRRRKAGPTIVRFG